MIVIETQILNSKKEKRLVSNYTVKEEILESARGTKREVMIRQIEAHAREVVKAISKMTDAEFEKNLL